MLSIVNLYLVTPAIIAIVVRYKDSRGHKGIGFFRFLYLCLNRGDITDRFPVLIFVVLYLLFASQSYVLDGGPGNWLVKAFGMVLLLLLCCVSLFLASVVYNFSDFRKNNFFLADFADYADFDELNLCIHSICVNLRNLWETKKLLSLHLKNKTGFAFTKSVSIITVISFYFVKISFSWETILELLLILLRMSCIKAESFSYHLFW